MMMMVLYAILLLVLIFFWPGGGGQACFYVIMEPLSITRNRLEPWFAFSLHTVLRQLVLS